VISWKIKDLTLSPSELIPPEDSAANFGIKLINTTSEAGFTHMSAVQGKIEHRK
jgi:hypothetical protein